MKLLKEFNNTIDTITLKVKKIEEPLVEYKHTEEDVKELIYKGIIIQNEFSINYILQILLTLDRKEYKILNDLFEIQYSSFIAPLEFNTKTHKVYINYASMTIHSITIAELNPASSSSQTKHINDNKFFKLLLWQLR